MICGALQTLNEEAFEDVASNEMSGVAPGETLSQQLAPIREEFNTSMDSDLSALGPSNGSNGVGVFVGGGGGSRSDVGGLRDTNPLVLEPTKMGTSKPGSSSSDFYSAAVDLEPRGDQEQLQPRKEATVIVMSQFSKNISDSSL